MVCGWVGGWVGWCVCVCIYVCVWVYEQVCVCVWMWMCVGVCACVGECGGVGLSKRLRSGRGAGVAFSSPPSVPRSVVTCVWDVLTRVQSSKITADQSAPRNPAVGYLTEATPLAFAKGVTFCLANREELGATGVPLAPGGWVGPAGLPPRGGGLLGGQRRPVFFIQNA